MEMLDADLFAKYSWVAELKESVNAINNEYIIKWAKNVIELGEEDVELDKWLAIFKKNVKDRYIELVADVEAMKEKLIDEISELMEKHDRLSQQLGMKNSLSDIDPKINYYQVKAELIKRTERLEKLYQEKQQEVNHLLHRQKELCALLEKNVCELQITPLPKREQIEKVQKYVEEMENEKYNREERYLHLTESIKKIAIQIGITPKSDFERNILGEDQIEIDISKSNMESMETFYEHLKKQYVSVKEEIDTLRNNIEDLWTILEESITEKENFNEKNSDYCLNTLKALRLEYKRCEELKKANIKTFVEKLRTELRSLWNICYYEHVEQMNNFPWFTSDFYTEDLLLYHEKEVEKWRFFYAENEKLIKLFTEHQKLWKKLLEFQDKQLTGMDRFKNRGGQLLQEEKERNALAKKIPQIEDHIKRLALEYEHLNNSPFKIFNTPILEYIENLHAEKEEQKKIKLSARKQAREKEGLSKTKSCANLTNRITPLNPTRHTPQSTLKKFFKESQTTGKKHISNKKPVLHVSSKSQNLVNKSRRLSREKSKKCRRKLNMKPGDDATNTHNATNMTDYDAFERNLSDRQDNFRSTLNIRDETCAGNLPIPTVNIVPATPNRNARKSPRSVKKLTTTPTNLKLIF